MDNNVKVNINVTSNGTTDRETKKAKELHAAYDQAAKAAGRVGTAGSRAVAAKALPPSDRPTSQTLGRDPVAAEVQQYGQQRGAAGMTGASARDFANQAQGLGGLVRLYATYAANVFAVGMAFRALSTAMDTTNMVRGLDQIGAASGVALGALSKELVAATGGAISLREAMTATVKVTAAGLGSENVLRLGAVASKASQALGVDMTDAISRLSRGITKLEPELLDELGIFTKIEPAVQKYALSVGKTASQLTDFERRQAFANAVLEEGEKKFASIQVDANPYNKLAASFQNIAQSGLELVNKVLAPIVNILSNSPTALVSIISLFGVKLLQQVLPALSEFKTGLESAAAKSTEVLKQRVDEAQQLRKKASDIAAKNLNIQIEKEIDAVAKAEQKMQALRDKRQFSSVRSEEGKAAITTLQDPFLDPNSQRAADAIKVAQLEAARISKLRAKGSVEEARAIGELASSTERWGAATKSAADVTTKLDTETKRLSRSLVSVLGINTRLSESAEKTALRNSIVQTAAYNGSVVGLTTSLSILRDEIQKENITGLSKATLLARGAFAALTGVVSTLFSALSKLFFYVGIIIAAYEALQLLYSFLSKNQKEQKAFADAIDKGTSRLEAFGRTIDYINKLPFVEQINSTNIGAKAAAIGELSNSMQELAKSFAEQQRAAGVIDITVDKLKGLVGFTTKTEEFSKSFGKTLFTGLKNAGSSAQAEEAKKAISEVLQIDFDKTSEKQFIEAFAKIARSSEKVDNVTGSFKNLSTEFSASASRSKELKSATEELDKAYKTFFDGLKSTDSFDVFAVKLKETGIKLLQALSDPERALSDLVQLINTPSSAQFFSQEAFTQLQEAKKRLEALNEEQARNIALINDSTEAYRKAVLDRQKVEEKVKPVTSSWSLGTKMPQNQAPRAVAPEITAAQDRVSEAREAVDAAQKVLDESKANGVKAAREFSLTALNAFERGSNITGLKIEAALSKGATIVKDNLLGVLGDLPGIGALRAENEKRQLAIQASLIKATLDQVNETRQNTLALEKNNLIRQVEAANASAGVFSQAEIDKIVVPAKAAIEAITKLQTTIGAGPRAAQQVVREGITSNRAILTAKDKGGVVTQEQLSSATEQLKIFDQAQEFMSRQAALYGQLNELAQKRLSIDDTKIITGLREQEKVTQGIYARQLRGVQTSLEELQTQESLTGFLTEQQRAKQEQLLIDALSLQQSQEVSQILTDITVQEFALQRLRKEQLKSGGSTKDILLAEEELIRRRQDLSKKGQENESKINQQELKNLQSRQRASREIFNFDQSAANTIVEGLTQQNALRLEADELELSRLQSIEGFSQIVLANSKAQIDSEKLLNQEQQQRYSLQLKQAGILKEQSDLKAQAELGGDTTEATRRNELALAAVNKEIELLAVRNSTQLKAIEQTRQLAVEQAKYNQLITAANSVAESLRSVFSGLSVSADKFGQSLGSIVSTLAESAVNSEKNAKNVLEAENALKAARSRELEATEPDDAMAGYSDRIKAEKELSKANTKKTQDELTNNIKLVSSAKNLFKEKTGAYRVLAAVEKAMFIAKLAMDVKTLASTVATQTGETAAANAGFFARAGTYVTEIFAKITSQLGVLGPAVAVAIIAAIGLSAFSKGGKGSTGPTAEERQKVQGSAIGYNAEGKIERNAQGEAIAFRRGALGDPEAQSKILETGLKALTENGGDVLAVNQDMLSALYKIEAGLRGVSAGIYGVTGLASGSLFGTQTGSKSSMLGLSKTTKEITDSGLVLSGSLFDLANNTRDAIDVFETVRTTKKRLTGTKVSDFTQVKGFEEIEDQRAAERLYRALSKTFSGAIDLLEASLVAVGYSETIAESMLAGLGDLPEELKKFSVRGLKPEEIGPALQRYVGSVIGFFGEELFGSKFDDLQRSGEEVAETVLRVVATNTTLNESFKTLGLEDFTSRVKKLTGLTGVDLTVAVGEAVERMGDLVGGTERLIEGLQRIESKFLTGAEQRAASTRRINDALKPLGIEDPSKIFTNRRDYATLTTELLALGSQPGATEAIKKLGTELFNLEGDFDTIFPALQDGEKAIESFVKTTKKQVSDLNNQLGLIGATDYAKAISGFTQQYLDTIQNLNEQGALTKETLAEADALLAAQQALLDAQNAAKATEMIVGLNAEVANMSLGAVGKEMLGIANKARDYARQLVNLNQATEENIAALIAWESAMMEAARTTRREAQAVQYAQLFSANQSEALAAKFAKLGFSLPGNIQQLQLIVDGIDATTDAGLELKGKILDLGSEFKSLIDSASNTLRSAYDARVQEVKGLQDQFKNFAKSIKDFRQSLLTGAMSPLTPIQRYEQTKMEFERVAALAATGDVQAMEKLQDASSSFLDASREVYASSELYTQDFNTVLAVLDNTASVAERQIEIAESTLEEIKRVVGGLITLNETTTATNGSITGLGPQLEEAIANYTTTTTTITDDALRAQAVEASKVAEAIGNVASGITQVNLNDTSTNTALNNLAKAQTTAAGIMAQAVIDNAKIISDAAAGWLASVIAANQPTPTPPSPPPPPPPPPPIIEPIIYYYDYGNAGGAGGGFDIGGGFSGSGGGFSEGNGQDGGGQEGGPGASQAKGGAWLSGYQLFARGGIVDSPTLFNYARGKGIMGEAGPEAIMPLRRDAQGNLGVIAQQNNDELLAEIAKLNEQVQQLTKVVAQGAVINAQATDRNTEAITTTIQTTTQEKQYMKKVQSRTNVV